VRTGDEGGKTAPGKTRQSSTEKSGVISLGGYQAGRETKNEGSRKKSKGGGRLAQPRKRKGMLDQRGGRVTSHAAK